MASFNEHFRLMREVQNLLLQDPADTPIETCSDEYETEEDDCSYNYNDEKVYICNYDTIYVCLYEELEEYRTSKQAKKKNTTYSWNNLLVVLPGGSITSMQNAPSIISKEATKLTTAEKKPEPSVQESAKQKTSNSNNITQSHVSETKAAKFGSAQSSKPKLSKKKLKKQRQKERKKLENKGKQKESKEKDQEEEAEEENDDEIAADDEEELEYVISEDKPQSESKEERIESVQDEIDYQKSEGNNQACADIYLSDEMASSAFVSNALKKKKIVIKKEEKAVKTSDITKPNKKVVSVRQKPVEKKTAQPFKPKATSINTPSTSAQLSVDPEFDFTVKKIKRPKATGNEYRAAVGLGEKAYELIMSDNVSSAVFFLTEAIRCNSYDLRHYLNRSFCYLRIGSYDLALKDAQVVIKYTNERDELIKAMFRSGQAFCGLQNFEEAEKLLDEAYNLSQADLHIHRELMRVRVLQLLYMGFRERDILEAFKERSSVDDVVSILTQKTSVDKDDDYSYENESEDDVYNSDDEENPSFTRMLSNMLKYQRGVSKKIPFVPSSPSKIMNPIQQTATGSYRNTVFTEAKKIINTVLPKPIVPNKGVLNGKAIWVGNTTSEVTDNMLRKKFTRYGKILSIFRKPNETYTFINFESAKAVTKLLTAIAKTNSVEVEGHKLLVKAATRFK